MLRFSVLLYIKKILLFIKFFISFLVFKSFILKLNLQGHQTLKPYLQVSLKRNFSYGS